MYAQYCTYAEGLLALDKDNKWVSCLAQDWRWLDDRTIEFRLRKGVTFHNGQEFNGDAVLINWEAYKRMTRPRPLRFLVLPDETTLEIIDKYLIRFTFPKPDGLAFVRLRYFFQFAPDFFKKHRFEEGNWGYLPRAGPWGTGPFELVEGVTLFAKSSERLVLEAYEDYWDIHYPRVRKVIFENSLIGDRQKATRLCRETDGNVDIVSHIRPLETLHVAESKFAKVVKSKDVTLMMGYEPIDVLKSNLTILAQETDASINHYIPRIWTRRQFELLDPSARNLEYYVEMCAFIERQVNLGRHTIGAFFEQRFGIQPFTKRYRS